MFDSLNSYRQRLQTFLLTHVSLYLAVGFIISAICIWVFAKLADSVTENESLVQFDLAVANFLHSNTQPDTIAFFLSLTRLGPQIMLILNIAIAVFYALRRAWFATSIWITAIGGGELLNFLLKTLFERSRPVFTNPIIVEQFFSFPSGHAMLSMIGYGMLAYFVVLRAQNRWVSFATILIAAIIIILIGFSRIYLGVHYFSDVVAGYAAGGLWLITCIGALEFIRRRQSKSNLA